MKIVGVLIWYDERPEWLAASVAAAAKLCDSILAVDGAYFLFPDALRHPTSGAGQAEAILETAVACGKECIIRIPQEAWQGNEVGKLQACLDLGLAKPMEDWYFKFDADELLTDVPFDVRDRLEETDLHTVDMRMWERDDEGMQHSMWPIRRLYRSLPQMTYGPAHHIISGVVDGERIFLSDAEDRARIVPGLDMQDLRMEHRNRYRSKTRMDRKDEYYHQRDALGIEKEDAWPTSRRLTSVNGQSSRTVPTSS